MKITDSAFHQLISPTAEWLTQVPVQLAKQEAEYRRKHSWYNSPGINVRTLTSRTTSYSPNNRPNPYNLMAFLCQHVKYTTLTKISARPIYRTISSEESESLTLERFLNDYTNSTNNVEIRFYHIPKGKSYIKKLLDESEYTKNKAIPQLNIMCQTSQTHFVRCYKGLPFTSNPDSIHVFTDNPTLEMLETIYMMLPNLLNINSINLEQLGYTEGAEIPRALYVLREQTEIIRAIFTLFYEASKIPAATYDYTANTELLIRLLARFTELAEWGTVNTDDFTHNLANIRVTSTKSSLESRLRSISSDIDTYENRLDNLYNEKRQKELQLMQLQYATAEDLNEFNEVLKNNKAIEILEADKNQLTLRITAPVQFFTPNDLEIYERNPTSTYMRAVQTLPNKAQNVLHKIFVTREYRLIMQGVIIAKINADNSSTPLSLRATNTNYTECPNPHLYFYDCWSKAKNEINKNINEGNYILVISQLIAAVQTINIAETQSFIYKLIERILGYPEDYHIHVIDENGTRHTWEEILIHEKELETEKIKETIENAPKGEYTQIVLPDEDDEDFEGDEE